MILKFMLFNNIKRIITLNCSKDCLYLYLYKDG